MLTVYNTMTRKKEAFHPLRTGEVSIYCCGVTPYNDPHIGNARPFVTWDVIRRFLSRKGYRVRYIQNFTDVDAKIINAANREGVTWKEISDGFCAVESGKAGRTLMGQPLGERASRLAYRVFGNVREVPR